MFKNKVCHAYNIFIMNDVRSYCNDISKTVIQSMQGTHTQKMHIFETQCTGLYSRYLVRIYSTYMCIRKMFFRRTAVLHIVHNNWNENISINFAQKTRIFLNIFPRKFHLIFGPLASFSFDSICPLFNTSL